MQQTSLLCGCGSPDLFRRGLCRRCERRARLSREHFDGLREFVLARDGHQCQACGELASDKLLVHHRRPGNRLPNLLTLCRACHVRVHRTWRPRFGFASVPLLRRLWREANRGLAEQRLLALLADDKASGETERQSALFA
jgi:5-methylcytosine-specific restriction endonuclease McrA